MVSHIEGVGNDSNKNSTENVRPQHNFRSEMNMRLSVHTYHTEMPSLRQVQLVAAAIPVRLLQQGQREILAPSVVTVAVI